jgi:hypothetical protein
MAASGAARRAESARLSYRGVFLYIAMRAYVLIVPIMLLGACAAEPPRYGEVVTLKAGEARSVSGYPGAGTVWRLDENDLKALSPRPIVPAPPPPNISPPRRGSAPYPPPPPYYGPPPYWGPGY